MTDHKQIEVRVRGRMALVDEGIAPLIEQLWLAGIDTDLSCEENQPGIAWIDFASVADAHKFLAVAVPYDEDDDSLYHRAMRYDGSPSASWAYDIHLWDWSEDEPVIEDGGGRFRSPPDYHFSVSIRFPRSDMPRLVERLLAHNARERDKGRVSKRAVRPSAVGL